jgi:arthrofactin-type cyclic lipopeptide synthetase C
MYKTGDIGRYRKNGELEFIARIDNQVKVHGMRIELGEIEVCLNRHPNVSTAVVMCHQNANNVNYLVGYIVAKEQGKLTSAELRKYLLGELPEHMVPTVFIMLVQMPLLAASGKIDRKALSQLKVADSSV